MIDPNILFYTLTATFTVIAVCLLIMAALFKKPNPHAVPEVADKHSTDETRGEEPPKAVEKKKKPIRYTVGDARNPELSITDHQPLTSEAAEKMSMTPYVVPNAVKNGVTQLLNLAAGGNDPIVGDGEYEIVISQQFLRTISNGINNLPAHLIKTVGPDSALTIWQVYRLIFGPDNENYQDVLASYSLYVEASTEKTLGASVFSAVSNSFAYLASVGQTLLDQTYQASQVDYHNNALNKIIAECSTERAIAESKLREPEQAILAVVFSRLGHKTRVKKFIGEIDSLAEAAFGCMLLLESAALAALLQQTLPVTPEQKKADMQTVLADIERFRGRLLTLQRHVDDRLPQLSSSFGALLKKQHDEQREEIRAALRKRLPDVQRNLESCASAIKRSLSDLLRETDSDRPSMRVIARVTNSQVSALYKS